NANSTAPAASAANPPRSCSLVAPAAIAADTTIATTGTVGPSGATNDAGATRSANRGERSRSVAADTPVYVTRRASALTTASFTNDPVSANVSATTDVN